MTNGNQARRHRRLGGSRALGIAIGTPLFLFLVLPLFIVFPMSLNPGRYFEFPPSGASTTWFEAVFESSEWRDAGVLSVKLAVACAACSVALGTAAAFGIVRAHFPGKTLIIAFLISPLIVPEIIIAIGMYFVASDFDFIGSPWVIVAGQIVLATPVVAIVVAATLRGFDVSLERASMSLGAGRVATFMHVTLPLIRSGIFTAALFAFLVSFDNLLIALYLGGPQTTTVPMQIWNGIRFDTTPAIAVVSTILVTLAFAVLLVGEVLRRRTQSRRVGAH